MVESTTIEPLVESVPAVCEYSDVFSIKIPSVLPREMDFLTDLTLGDTPISKAPYRMAPAELKEWKT